MAVTDEGSAGGLWQAGKLADKPVTTFVSSASTAVRSRRSCP
ncbi:hypothetical protein [Streptomyces turgidiscabies]|nr:hypothetical protein [Streptomyces turgidiscabies]